MMSPENVAWAFYSEQHRRLDRDNAEFDKKTLPNDSYYMDMYGKWVLVTAIFECIDTARRNYKYADVVYLGAVDKSTRTEVAFGKVYPPPAAVVMAEKPIIRKKKLKSPIFSPGSIKVKNAPMYLYDEWDNTWKERASIYNNYYGDKIRIP